MMSPALIATYDYGMVMIWLMTFDVAKEMILMFLVVMILMMMMMMMMMRRRRRRRWTMPQLPLVNFCRKTKMKIRAASATVFSVSVTRPPDQTKRVRLKAPQRLPDLPPNFPTTK